MAVVAALVFSPTAPAAPAPATPASAAETAVALPPGLGPLVRTASDFAERTRAGLALPEGMKAEVWAAEPLIGDPVAISFDRHGRLYVAEHHRNRHGTEDNREHRYWLEDDLAARTTEDRLAYMEKWAAAGKRPMNFYTEVPDRLVCLEDRDGDGRAEVSRVLATFADPLDGANVGVLARDGEVWVTCIPHLWRFQDSGQDGPAAGAPLFSGFGVKFTFHGHDMHGVVQGPDGRIYWSIGDRGYHVRTREGTTVADAWRGAVFRCEPDGARLEVFATGLRNPQELVFDDLGNLFTVDNDNDAIDEQPRLLHIVEGGDYGWHAGNLWIDERLPALAPRFRRPWYEDGLWQARFAGQPAWVMPPVAHLSNGPCGLTRDPGVTLLPEKWRGSFFLSDWAGGGRTNSPVIAFQVAAQGNGFAMTSQENFVTGVIPTDVEFGPDGRLYVVDMAGWELAPGGGRRTGRGVIFALGATSVPPATASAVATMRQWFKDGFAQLPETVLLERLAHADYRIRLESQLALAARDAAAPALARIAMRPGDLRARVHALQALGQIHRRTGRGLELALGMLGDADPEMRAQLARQLADTPVAAAAVRLGELLGDASPRARYFAIMALGRLGAAAPVAALAGVIRANNNEDVYLRHAAVLAFARLAANGQRDAVFALARDGSAAVRLAVLLAQRRMAAPQIAGYLEDADPRLVAEAVRAIHDLSLVEILPALAARSRQLAAMDDATGRRVLNARYRLGRAEDAEALADVAADTAVSAALRREALALLAEWSQPQPGNRVTGEWMPLPERAVAPAVAAVRRVLPGLLQETRREVAAAAVGLAGQYQIKEGVDAVFAIARDPVQTVAARAAAAEALVFLTDRRGGELARELVRSEAPPLRIAGRNLLVAGDAKAGMDELALTFERGTLAEQQAAAGSLALQTDRRAYDLLVSQSEKSATGKLPAGLVLDLNEALEQGARLIGLTGAERNRRHHALARRQEAWRAQFPAGDPLGSHRVALMGGDAARGRDLFHQKVEFLCVRCHKSEGAGTSEVGPDLTGVGARLSREQLLRAIVEPAAELAAGFEYATLKLADGRTLAGAVQAETPAELRLSTTAEKTGPVVVVLKSEIKERAASSAMPPLVSLMSARELRDLVEYLATQTSGRN